MKIAVKECSFEELPVAEQKWQARGYFSSKASWVLTRRDPD